MYAATFNVQNFTLDVLSDTTVQLTCFFALNSFADGCNVTFNSINQSVLVSVFIPKENDDTIAITTCEIMNGFYEINVYDVCLYNSSSAPAVSREYNLTHSVSYNGQQTRAFYAGGNAMTIIYTYIVNFMI